MDHAAKRPLLHTHARDFSSLTMAQKLLANFFRVWESTLASLLHSTQCQWIISRDPFSMLESMRRFYAVISMPNYVDLSLSLSLFLWHWHTLWRLAFVVVYITVLFHRWCNYTLVSSKPLLLCGVAESSRHVSSRRRIQKRSHANLSQTRKRLESGGLFRTLNAIISQLKCRRSFNSGEITLDHCYFLAYYGM